MSSANDCSAPSRNASTAATNTNTIAATFSYANLSPTRWLTEEVFKLIDLVRSDEAIYNQRHKYYFCRPYVDSFWREVDAILEKHPGSSLAKWTNLRISFRREFTHFLQEKAPPCWAYFDRMLFLQPFLRRKKDMPHQIDTNNMQDPISRMNDIANNLQRQHVMAVAAAHAGPLLNANNNNVRNMQAPIARPHQLPFDTFFEHVSEHEAHNNAAQNGNAQEEQAQAQARYADMESELLQPQNIKVECDEQVDEFNTVVSDDNYDDDDEERHNRFRAEYLTRMGNVRRFINERSSQHADEGVTITEVGTEQAQASNGFDLPNFAQTSNGCFDQLNLCCEQPTSTTATNYQSQTDDMALAAQALANATSAANLNLLQAPTVAVSAQQGNTPNNYFHQRLEISAVSSGLPVATGATSRRARNVDLCECKTDPDAMFLMSLLPDIQKLDGRDRGKLKLAFQNILQMVLYPEHNR